MPQDFVQAWESAVQLINKLQAASSTHGSSAPEGLDYSSLLELSERLKACKPVAHGSWSKIITDMQVPRRLAAAVCVAPEQYSMLQVASLDLLLQPTAAAEDASLIGGRGSSSSRSASALAQELQDVQQCVLQQIPVLMHTLAVQLDSLQDSDLVLVAANSSTARLSRQDMAEPDSVAVHVYVLVHHAVRLLCCAHSLQSSQQELYTDAAFMRSALQMSFKAMRFVSRCVDQLPAQHQHAPARLHELWEQAFAVAHTALAEANFALDAARTDQQDDPTTTATSNSTSGSSNCWGSSSSSSSRWGHLHNHPDAAAFQEPAALPLVCVFTLAGMCPQPSAKKLASMGERSSSSSRASSNMGTLAGRCTEVPVEPGGAAAAGNSDGSHASSPGDNLEMELHPAVNRHRPAWAYACNHHARLPEQQQRLLQLLGCSSRALMYAVAAASPAIKDILATDCQIGSPAYTQDYLTLMLPEALQVLVEIELCRCQYLQAAQIARPQAASESAADSAQPATAGSTAPQLALAPPSAQAWAPHQQQQQLQPQKLLTEQQVEEKWQLHEGMLSVCLEWAGRPKHKPKPRASSTGSSSTGSSNQSSKVVPFFEGYRNCLCASIPTLDLLGVLHQLAGTGSGNVAEAARCQEGPADPSRMPAQPSDGAAEGPSPAALVRSMSLRVRDPAGLMRKWLKLTATAADQLLAQLHRVEAFSDAAASCDSAAADRGSSSRVGTATAEDNTFMDAALYSTTVLCSQLLAVADILTLPMTQAQGSVGQDNSSGGSVQPAQAQSQQQQQPATGVTIGKTAAAAGPKPASGGSAEPGSCGVAASVAAAVAFVRHSSFYSSDGSSDSASSDRSIVQLYGETAVHVIKLAPLQEAAMRRSVSVLALPAVDRPPIDICTSTWMPAEVLVSLCSNHRLLGGSCPPGVQDSEQHLRWLCFSASKGIRALVDTASAQLDFARAGSISMQLGEAEQHFLTQQRSSHSVLEGLLLKTANLLCHSATAAPAVPAAAVAAANSGEASSSSTGAVGNSAGGAAGHMEGTGSGGHALQCVPWLVLLGRCCLFWAEQLLCILERDPAYGAEAGSSVQAMNDTFSTCFANSLDLLQGSSTSAELAAAGYSIQLLLPSVQAAAAAQQAAKDAWGADSGHQLSQQLQVLGLALNNLPIDCACNNPYCSNMSGLSEQQLVTGSKRMCAGCQTACYCRKGCQTQHWKQHKAACKAMRAAASSSV